MEHRVSSQEFLLLANEKLPNDTGTPRPCPSRLPAEHLAMDALRPYDGEPLPPPRRAPPREEQEDGRLLRLALLPLASWCLGVLFDLPADEMLWAVMVAALVAGALALRR